MKNLVLLWLGLGAVVSQHIINPAEFPETQELIMDLGQVIGETSALQTCVAKVASPLDKAIGFVDDIMEIDRKVKKIEERIEVTTSIMQAVMLIPYVGQVAGVFLEPAITVLDTIDSGLEKVEPIIRHFAGTVARWTEPLKAVKSKVDWVEKTIGNFTNVVAVVDSKATAAEACTDELPAGRSHAIKALEHVSDALDVIPDGFNDALGHVNKACNKVEGFLSRIHAIRRRRGLPSLHKVIRVLDMILHAFGPVGHFLDEIDHVLHKKFCLIHSLEEVVKGVVHVGKEVIKGVEHVGKEVIHGAEHIIDEAGHVWAEVEDGVEHVAHELGKGVEHVAHEVGHVVHEVGEGVEHVVHEVGKGVEHVAHEVGKGVEHAAHEVGEGVEHVAHEVGKGVEHVAHEVEKGVSHVGHEVEKGVSHVGHEISKGVHHITHSISHAFHHVFGKRDLKLLREYRRNLPEAIYVIDGKFYALVDGRFDTRSRRGFDVCIRISDVLKGVNFVTGGLLNKAQSLIDHLFHGHSPFHIPGLTSDVFNIGSLLHHFDLGAVLPHIEDFLKLPQLDIKKFLQLDLKLFEKMLPDCKQAFAKVDMGLGK